MSGIDRRSLTHAEAYLLLHSGSFWPDLMVDKSSFMKMLLHVLNVEAHYQPDIETERWEQELTASGACNASGVLDVRHFVAFCLQGGLEGAETVLGMLSTIEEEDEILVAPSEPSNEMLAASNTKPGSPSNPSGRDMSASSWTLSAAWFGEQTRLPSPEDQEGAVVVVDSKQYVLGERLGRGGGGSVFAATLKREAADAA
eukprot:6196177-Amphidinium_carterae.1